MNFRPRTESTWKISVLLVSHNLCGQLCICNYGRHSEIEFMLFSYTSTPGGYLSAHGFTTLL